MTGQFYKTPQGFSALLFFRSGKPLGGFFVLLGRKQSDSPTSGLRFALRGSADHAFFLLAGNCLAFPKYSRPPCSIKHLVSSTLLEQPKGSRTGGKSGKICPGNELAPFVYIGFPHILNQISWLTVQQGADCFQRCPRYRCPLQSV